MHTAATTRVSVTDHFDQLEPSDGHSSDEDVVRHYVVLVVVLVAVLISSQLRLRSGSVNINERSWMAHFLKFLEQATVPRRLGGVDDVIEHDKVERCLFKRLGKGKVSDVAWKHNEEGNA